MSLNNKTMDLFDHLFELRERLIFCLLVFVLAWGGAWIFSSELLVWMAAPAAPYFEKLIFTAPMEEFLAHLKVTAFGALILACPFFIYQGWSFLAPGLYKNEKKVIILFSFFGAVLFCLGVLFIYFVVYPLSFRFLFNLGFAEPLISIREYLSFFIQTSLAFGILFETPLIIAGLSALGIVRTKQLKKRRREAVIVLAVLSAIVTPPDVLSMLFLLGPLYLLYEASIFVSSFFEKS